MDFDLFSCTDEHLKSLKFNELQKLCSKHKIKIRWAKKRELIDKLLLIKGQGIEKSNAMLDIKDTSSHSTENMEWIDGKKAFPPVQVEQPFETDRRLTYNVLKPALEEKDRRLTFTIEKQEINKCTLNTPGTGDYEGFNRRLTYNADELKQLQEKAKLCMESGISEKEVGPNLVSSTCKLNVETAPNIDFKKEPNDQSQSIEATLVEKHNILNGTESSSKDIINLEGSTGKGIRSSESQANKSSEVKMLTIPYTNTRILGQGRKGMAKESKESVISSAKLRDKFKNEKKRLDKNAVVNALKIKHPLMDKLPSSCKSIADKESSSQMMIKKIDIDNLGMKAQSNTLDPQRKMLPRRKSKTEDNVLVQNLNPKRNIKFFSPREAQLRGVEYTESPHNLTDIRLSKTRIPLSTSTLSTQKKIVPTKMPNFSKIHKKRFEQMDSLVDYMKKKEERARKLFGFTQPCHPEKVNKDDTANVFQAKSSQIEKENKHRSTGIPKKITSLATRDKKQKLNNKTFFSHTPVKTDILKNIKEENRIHLNGVRTNKRYELLMKARKIEI